MPNRLTPIARKLRRTSTATEDALWNVLRGSRLAGLKFRRQVPIAGFVADFACLSLGLTIEIDGPHHALRPIADRERRDAIERHGYLELRFTNDEVKTRLDWVVREILRAADISRARMPRDPYPRID